MLYHSVNLQKKDKVMLVNIMGPINNITTLTQLSQELNQIYEDVMFDEEIQVIVLSDEGKNSFSIEIDFLYSLIKDAEELSMKPWSLSEPIAKLDKPIIAAIQEDAIGQGLELALACDIRIASETSHFALPHIKTGFIPWDGGTQRLSRLIGKAYALEMVLTGKMINAQEALRIGLVNRVVPSKDILQFTLEMANEMASKAPLSLRYIKEAIYKGMDMTLEQGIRLEADLYLLLHTTKDRTEGIKAFRDKKTPRFEGR